ncbi:hypothetical protein MUGA111182_05900 [Mucilaginibacter galii]
MVKNFRIHSKNNTEFLTEIHHVKSVWFPIDDIIAMCNKLKTMQRDA